jgi:signal transduction histidine kinase
VAPLPASNRHKVLIWAAVATTCVAELPLWVELARRPELLSTLRFAAWMVLFVVFLAALVLHSGVPGRRTLALLALQSLSAVGMCYLLHNSLTSVLLVIIAAELPGVLPLRPSLVWIGAQTAGFAGSLVTQIGIVDGLILTAAFGSFELFSFYTFRVAESERQARADLAQVHESLLATRQLLAETTRAAERLRIAGELHDVLGHHLTALSLHLEAALHTPPEQTRERVQSAQELAKGLLREVRDVVSTLREDEPASLAALGALGAGIEEPRVHLAVEPGADLSDPAVSHAVLRCAQEVFTNAVRHAGASNLWLEVSRADGSLTLHARDDGRGASEVHPGNGLCGMRERIEKLGGRLDVATAPGQGFTVTAWIPLPVSEGLGGAG